MVFLYLLPSKSVLFCLILNSSFTPKGIKKEQPSLTTLKNKKLWIKLNFLQITELLYLIGAFLKRPDKGSIQHLINNLLTINHHTPLIYSGFLHIQKIILCPWPVI